MALFENRTSPLPSLNALRAFEAMARTGQATLAAEELHVTHSAVSRQVKALEAQLGQPLFTGPRNRLTLTQSGLDLLPALTEAFDRIETAVQSVRGDGGEDLHVAVNASISVKWLIPRLPEFARLRPKIRLQLSELASHATSHRGAHAVVRMVPVSRLSEPGVTWLMDAHLGPVMAPALAQSVGNDPLRAARLISTTHPQGWALWADLAGLDLHRAVERPFAHLHFAMDAALAGLGAAIMPWELVAQYIDKGRLVAPRGFEKTDTAFAVLRAQGVTSRALDQFTDRLVDQGKETPPVP